MPYKIFIIGEFTEFLSHVKDNMTSMLNSNIVEFEILSGEFIGDELDCDVIIFNSHQIFPGEIKLRAKQKNIPLVFITKESSENINFSLEEPIFFALVESDAKYIAEFITLITLFSRKISTLTKTDIIEDKIELLDEILNDFGSTINNRICTIIGYADFALNESSIHEMHKALEIALETGIDTAQILQNMLLSVKSIIKRNRYQKWAA